MTDDSCCDLSLNTTSDGSSHYIKARNTRILVPTIGRVTRDSSKVKSSIVVDFGWELREYSGRLVSAHKDGNFVAYTLQGHMNAVRVYNRVNKSRALIKGFTGLVMDISWAHMSQCLYLACVDQGGNLWVYQVLEIDDDFTVKKLLNIKTNSPGPDDAGIMNSTTAKSILPSINLLLCWCPYVPDEFEQSNGGDRHSAGDEIAPGQLLTNGANKGIRPAVEGGDQVMDQNGNGEKPDGVTTPSDSVFADFGRMLALVQGKTVYIINIGVGISHSDSFINIDSLGDSCFKINIAAKITAVSLSPDGSAVCVGDVEGNMRFFVLEESNKFRCAHKWQPYNNKHVDSLFFLDNVKQSDTPFWKFVLTSSDNNQELKIWSCETWQCLQTIRFASQDITLGNKLKFQIGVDLTASYVFLSDLTQKALYIVELVRSEVENDDAGTIRFASISDFHLVQPALSLSIIDVSKKRFRPFSPSDNSEGDALATPTGDDENEVDSSIGKVSGVRALLYAVNPRSLLEMEIRYQPALCFENGTADSSNRDSSVSTTEFNFHDGLSDLSAEVSELSLTTPIGISSGQDNIQPTLLSPQDIKNQVQLTNGTDVDLAGTTTSPFTTMKLGVSSAVTNLVDDRHTSASPDSQEVSQFMSRDGVAVSQAGLGLSVQAQNEINLVSTAEQLVHLTVEQGHPASVDVRPHTPVADVLEDLQGDVFFKTHVSGASGSSSGVGHESGMRRLRMEMEQIRKESADVKQMCSQILTGLNNLQMQQSLVQTPQPFAGQAIVNSATSPSSSATPSSLQQAQLTNILLALENEREAIQKVSANLLSQTSQANAFNPDQMWANVSSLINDWVSQRVGDAVKTEVRAVASVAVHESLEPIGAQIASRLSANDSLLRDSINKMLKSKQFTETISSAVASTLSTSIHQAFRDTFTQIIVPAFDESCKGVFSQMDMTYKAGLKQYADQMKTQVDLLSKRHDALLQANSQKLEEWQERLGGTVKTLVETQVNAAFQSMQQEVVDKLSSVVTDELAVLREQQNALGKVLRSAAPTPVPNQISQIDLQKRLLNLVQTNRAQEAFQQALTANDLQLVVWLCGRINPTQLFAQKPCPLEQHVILSLVSQLSADLASHSELKIKYLEESLLAVDANNAALRDHIKHIVGGLIDQIVSFNKANPGSPHARPLRMILMCAQGIIHSDI